MVEPTARMFGRYLFGRGHRGRPFGRAVGRFLRRPDVGFTFQFALLSLVAWLLYVTFAGRLLPFADLTAVAVAWSSNLLGMGAAVTGNVVSFGGGSYSYVVDLGCTGLFVSVLFVAAVLAYPATVAQRTIGLAVGIPLLLLVNWARLLSMAWLGLHVPALVESAHVFWWQAFLLLATGIGWLAWIRLVGERPRSAARRRHVRDLAAAAAIFAVLMALLAAVAVASPADEAYRALVHGASVHAASALGMEGEPRHALSALLAFGAVGSAGALFLATPRASWGVRLRGAAAWGILSCGVYQVALTLAYHASRDATPGAGAAVRLLAVTIHLALPAAAWYAWVRRHDLLPPVDVARRYECPECGRDHVDVLAHVQRSHAPRAHALVRSLARKHPELEAEVGKREHEGA